MSSSALLSLVSVGGCCTGFVLMCTVALAAYHFVKAGTVGKTTITFYALVCFNGTMWITYGVFLDALAIILPNVWGILTATFALACYLSTLKKEVEEAKLRANAGPQDVPAAIIVAANSEGLPEASVAKEVAYVSSPPEKDIVGGGESLAMVAEQLEMRFAAAKKTAMLLITTAAVVFAIILLTYSASYTSEATSIAGTMAVIMATIMFTGPLDQVSWIVKNKNSIPLDPLTTVVGIVNASVWVVYGFLTNDTFVWAPNTVAFALCVLQLGLILVFPRKVVEEEAQIN